ncbi:MAG: phenylalanine--tRNA ligase subunit beta [Legionellales bacterium RIFCSPHIGHO2_12_FULL_35_11]|nr:MAG: phenylalanine--tRNA ligase subunit beta [Legionellales bacterium RIFCSPHIGHO2_12_FULL_35_11]
MKICESWIREWVSPNLNTDELSAQLTMLGLEVDSLSQAAGNFCKIIVAKVISVKKHPEADKLSLCEVDDGVSVLQVVCGAANVRTGLKVALATIGAKLPNGMVIKKSKLRGEESNGMLCSASELGLEENSEGIIELPEDAPIGKDIIEYLSLNDSIFDIDLTPNRADCFSVLGIAREIAAKNNLQLKQHSNDKAPININDTLDISISEPEACGRYFGRIIKGINKNAITPIWLKERLRRSGIRVLHPVVDILNYVMLEIGQPMHAFDLEKINSTIHVRYAKKNEELLLLNGQQVALSEDVLVIADKIKPLAIAGVMGGEESAVQDQTADIFLECAYFNPVSLANIARKFGLSSDSSQRYERGVDPCLQEIAIERASCLILEIVGGEAGPISESTSFHQEEVKIYFNPTSVLKITGIDVPEHEMLQMFQSLGMKTSNSGGSWEVIVPSHRFDLRLEVDLVEEIVRLYGFDRIPRDVLNISMQAGKINSEENILQKARAFLAGRGYYETISYSFVDPNLQEILYPDFSAKKLLNPISADLSVMRVGLWSGLIAAQIHNIHRQQSGVKLFESGVVFKNEKDGLKEITCLAGLITGKHGNLNWSEQTGVYDFFDMKGDLESLFAVNGLKNIQFIPKEHAALHPGKSAQIMFGDIVIGNIGVLHPRYTDIFDFTNEVILFELELTNLNMAKPVVYQPISKYPQTSRDLSFIVNENISAMQIEKSVRDIVSASLLKSFDIFDLYIGEKIPKNKKSLAISLTLQNDSRTLVDTEINEIMDNVLKKLELDYSIELRTVGESIVS